MASPALKPLPEAMASLPVPKSRGTGARWLRLYPGLGMAIGGRCYLYQAAFEAISRGVPLAEAARIGADSGRAAA